MKYLPESLGTPLDRHSLRALYFFSSPASQVVRAEPIFAIRTDNKIQAKVASKRWGCEQVRSISCSGLVLHQRRTNSTPPMTGPLLPSPLRKKSVIAFLFSFIYLFFKFNFLVHHQRNNNLTKMCEAKTCLMKGVAGARTKK